MPTLSPVYEGQRPSAEWHNTLAEMTRQGDSAPDAIVDSLGITSRGPYLQQATTFRWGKLNAGLGSGSTAGVSLWQTTGGGWEGWDEDSGIDWTCHAPPLLSSGSIVAGKWVLVGIINGRKVVLEHEC